MGKVEDYKVIEQDMESLYLGNLNTVEFDLPLPLEGQHGSCIEWATSHEGILSSRGRVCRPSFGMGNRKIQLTATFTYGQASGQKVYEVTVLEEEKNLTIVEIYPIHIQADICHSVYLPAYAIVRTADGDVIVWEIVWEEDRCQKFSEVGHYEKRGNLAKTGQKIVAQIEVLDMLSIEYMEKNPQLISLWDEVEGGDMLLDKDSSLYSMQQNMHHYLLDQDVDQMLYNFKVAAGLDTKGAAPMTGWDSPDGLLRGHTSGHYLSALALAYHATGKSEFRERATYMVEELWKCQQAFSQMEGYQPGFLSAYSQDQYDQLEAYVKYPDIWAPYYTLHKILAGLLDCYQWCKLPQALEIADGIGEWVSQRLGRLSKEQLEKMWGIYIAGEFGGMNESLATLSGYTGKSQYVQTAKLFDNEKLFAPLAQGVDALSGLHANQHIPQIIGAMKIFGQTGEAYYYQIAKTFWQFVTQSHIYVNGGTGESEMFHQKDHNLDLLTDSTTESCASYNMLKLTKLLFAYAPDASYMDYYERTMLNHIQATLDKSGSGESTYFFPMCSDGRREFLYENSCCHGTGMESHSKYMEAVYFYGAETLFVNLFVASKTRWTQGGVTITQAWKEECPQNISVILKQDESGAAKHKLSRIKIRKPGWSTSEYQVQINAAPARVSGEGDGYLSIPAQWDENGAMTIQILFPCELQFETARENPEYGTFRYGPYIMARINTDQEEHTEQYKEQYKKRYKKQLIPLYQVDTETYQVYQKGGPRCWQQTSDRKSKS